jgi:ankyrin repeat protein
LKLAADIADRLGRLPDTLEGSYFEIFQQIQASGNYAARLATLTFQWLLYVQYDLSTEAFAGIVSAALVQGNDLAIGVSANEVLDVCANLVVVQRGIDGETFGFAHLSVREFLEKLPNRRIDIFLPERSHASIASACLTHIRTILAPSPKGIAILPRRDRAYPLWGWIEHVNKSGELRKVAPLGQQIMEFLLVNRVDKVSSSYWKWCRDCQLYIPDIVRTNRCLSDATANAPNPVWLACILGWFEVVEALYRANYDGLESSCVLNASLSPWEGLVTPFWYAILKGNIPLMECLLRCGTDPTQLRPTISESPLMYATKCNNSAVLSVLLKYDYGGHDIALQAFDLAMGLRNYDVLNVLLDNAVKIDEVRRKLESAAKTSGWPQMVTFAISKGVGLEDIERCVPISAVCVQLSASPYIHHPTRGKNLDRLLNAVYRDEPNAVRELVSSGKPEFNMSRALYTANLEGRDECAAVLFEHGARLSGVDLVRALIQDAPSAALSLIAAGLDVRGRYLDKKRTALHYAAEKGFTAVVEALLDKGARPNIRDWEQRTPLHLAAAWGRDGCVQLLLDGGADVMLVEAFGKTALELAQTRCHASTVQLIQQWLDAKRKFVTESDDEIALPVRSKMRVTGPEPHEATEDGDDCLMAGTEDYIDGKD